MASRWIYYQTLEMAQEHQFRSVFEGWVDKSRKTDKVSVENQVAKNQPLILFESNLT